MSIDRNRAASKLSPVDGRLGWICVCGVFMINAHTWGLNASYSVFLSFYLESDLYPGASPLTWAFVGGLCISQAFLVAPLVEWHCSSRSRRWLLLAGALLEGVSFVAASFATKTWHLFLTQGLCFGYGMGLLYTGTVGSVTPWFAEKRGLANALASSGSGVGGLVYSLATEALIRNLGYTASLRVLGIIAFAANTAAVLAIRDPGTPTVAINHAATHKLHLFKDGSFVAVFIFGIFSIMAYVVCLYSLPTYAATIGLSSSQGSLAAALLSVAQVIGRPAVGHLSDRFNRFLVASIASSVAGIICLAFWAIVKTSAALYALSILLGTVAGTYFAVIAPILTQVVGLELTDSAISLAWLGLVIPSTVSQAIALAITEANSGRFWGAFVFTGIMYICAAMSVLFPRFRRRHRHYSD